MTKRVSREKVFNIIKRMEKRKKEEKWLNMRLYLQNPEKRATKISILQDKITELESLIHTPYDGNSAFSLARIKSEITLCKEQITEFNSLENELLHIDSYYNHAKQMS